MDEDRSMAPLYVAGGIVAAAAIGYLVWRYALSDETKERIAEAIVEGNQRATDAVKSVKEKAKAFTK